jgi:hypothetical protein
VTLAQAREKRRVIFGRSVPKLFAGGGWVRVLAAAALVVAFAHLVLFRADPLGTFSGLDLKRKRGHTDHVAHVGETRLFPSLGPVMWRVPALELFRRLTPAEIEALPDDLRTYAHIFPQDMQFVPGYPPTRPIVLNFPHVPRVYPPGVYLFGAPSAVLYQFGLISFGASNRLFLAVLALAWFAAVLAWTRSWREAKPSLGRQLGTAIVVFYSYYWTMEGFYDIGAVALASIAFEAGRQRRPGLASFSSGLSVLVHPRLFMLAPPLLAEFWPALRRFRELTPRERALVVAGVVCFAGAVAFAYMIQSTVTLHAIKQPPNPLIPGRGPWYLVVGFWGLILALVLLLLREGSRLDALTVLIGGLAFGTQRYFAPWYWLPMLPWALSPAPSATGSLRMSKTAAAARAIIVVLFFVASNAQRW